MVSPSDNGSRLSSSSYQLTTLLWRTLSGGLTRRFDAVMLSAGEREEQTDTSTRQGERRSTNRAAAVARRVACAPYRLTATLGAHSHTSSSSTFSFGKREHFALERLAISTETITTYERLAKLLDLQYRRAHPTYWLLLASIRGVYYVMEKVRRPCNGGLY